MHGFGIENIAVCREMNLLVVLDLKSGNGLFRFEERV